MRHRGQGGGRTGEKMNSIFFFIFFVRSPSVFFFAVAEGCIFFAWAGLAPFFLPEINCQLYFFMLHFGWMSFLTDRSCLFKYNKDFTYDGVQESSISSAGGFWIWYFEIFHMISMFFIHFRYESKYQKSEDMKIEPRPDLSLDLIEHLQIRKKSSRCNLNDA